MRMLVATLAAGLAALFLPLTANASLLTFEFSGRVSDDELQRLYRDCRCFVMPSRHEGFGLVFLEAMRAGKPCIGAIGSASEIIEHEKTGFVFDAGDRANIQAACIRLLSDPELAARMGEHGRVREAEQFSRSAFRRRLATLTLGLPKVG